MYSLRSARVHVLISNSRQVTALNYPHYNPTQNFLQCVDHRRYRKSFRAHVNFRKVSKYLMYWSRQSTFLIVSGLCTCCNLNLLLAFTYATIPESRALWTRRNKRSTTAISANAESSLDVILTGSSRGYARNTVIPCYRVYPFATSLLGIRRSTHMHLKSWKRYGRHMYLRGM